MSSVYLTDVVKETGAEFKEISKIALSKNIPMSKDAQGRYTISEEDKAKIVSELREGKPKEESSPKVEQTIKEPAKREKKPVQAESKRGAKSGVSLLKSMISSSFDIQGARSFLLESKISTPLEVALMTDEEVLKKTKGYSLLTVGNGKDSVRVAIPTEVLKSIDYSKISVF